MPRLRRAAASITAALALTAGCSGGEPPSRLAVGSPGFLQAVDRALDGSQNRLVAAPCTHRGDSGPISADDRNADMAGLTPALWRSGDVGVSTKLSDGRVLWVFGDTTRTPGATPRMVANSMLVSSGRCFAEVRTAGEGPVIPTRVRTGVDMACWPNSAVTIPMGQRDVVLVGCSRVQRQREGTDGVFSFRYRGMTMAVFAVRGAGVPALVQQVDITPDRDDVTQVNWGAALVADDHDVYIYGSKQVGDGAGKGAYLARAPLHDVLDQRRWHFWNGSAFVANPHAAQPLIPASQGVSQTFSVVPWKGGYVMVSKQGGEFGPNIGVWTAARPEGPWSGYRAVPEPYDRGGGIVAYQPLAHPELPTPSGNLLVTMSRTTADIRALLADPRRARPLFLEVPAP